MIANLLIRFFLWLARSRPARTIMTRDGKGKYLTRHFLTEGAAATEGMDRHDDNVPRWGLYLHHFHASDDGAELHNHPWKWAVSLVLKGGYSEERCYGCKAYYVLRRAVKPWRLNFLRGDTFHRVDLRPGQDAWTLFLVGPITQSWGFWDRNTWKFTPWKTFLGVK